MIIVTIHMVIFSNVFITVLLLIIVMENSQVLRFSQVYEIQHPDVCNVSSSRTYPHVTTNTCLFFLLWKI